MIFSSNLSLFCSLVNVHNSNMNNTRTGSNTLTQVLTRCTVCVVMDETMRSKTSGVRGQGSAAWGSLRLSWKMTWTKNTYFISVLKTCSWSQPSSTSQHIFLDLNEPSPTNRFGFFSSVLKESDLQLTSKKKYIKKLSVQMRRQTVPQEEEGCAVARYNQYVSWWVSWMWMWVCAAVGHESKTQLESLILKTSLKTAYYCSSSTLSGLPLTVTTTWRRSLM